MLAAVHSPRRRPRSDPSWLPRVTVPDATATVDIAAMDRWELEPETAPEELELEPEPAPAGPVSYAEVCELAMEAAEAAAAAGRSEADGWIARVGGGLGPCDLLPVSAALSLFSFVTQLIESQQVCGVAGWPNANGVCVSVGGEGAAGTAGG